MNQKTMAAVFVMALEDFDNQKLAAMNNGIQLWGKLEPSNLAYKDALDRNLIKNNGIPFDSEALKDALTFEVNRRVESGTFQ